MKQKSLEIRNSKFGKIRFVTEFEKWHSDSEFEEQNSAVCSNIRQHSPTYSYVARNSCSAVKKLIGIFLLIYLELNELKKRKFMNTD